MNADELDVDLRRQIMNGRICPFVGSGVSSAVINRETGDRLFPSWSELLERVADRLVRHNPQEPYCGETLSAAAKWTGNVTFWRQALDAAREKLSGKPWYELLEEMFDKEEEEAAPGSLELAKLVWEISSGLVITTNYDRSLAWAKPSCRELRRTDAAQIVRALGSSNGRAQLLFLHGSIHEVENLVVTDADYRVCYEKNEHPAPVEAVRNIAANGTSLLFVGYGLKDFELKKLLEKTQRIFANGTEKHYAIVHAREAEKLRGSPIKPIPYESRAEIADILRTLAGLRKPGNLESERPTCIPQSEPGAPNATAPSNVPVENAISLRQLFKDYKIPAMKAAGLALTTIADYRRAVDRWSNFERDQLKDSSSNRHFYFIHEIDELLLKKFYRWMLATETESTARYTVRNVATVLKVAVDERLLATRPRGSVGVRKAPTMNAQKPLLQMHQLEKMWRAIPEAKWPRRTDQRTKPLWSTADFWRAAFVLWLTYGFKTQELMSHEEKYTPIRWQDVQFGEQWRTNGEAGFGFISFVPQQQRRNKPDPVILPLTRHACIALKRLKPESSHLSQRIFNSPLSSTSFRATWKAVFARAAGSPTAGAIAPKDLRTVAFHNLESHAGGISQYVSGKYRDRSPAARVPGPGGSWIPLSEKLASFYSTFEFYNFFRDLEEMKH